MYDQLSLYPVTNSKRLSLSLDGMWNFCFDPESIGEKENWMSGLRSSVSLPVPSSFQDLFTDQYSKNYCGDFWYERDFFVPEHDGNIQLRFGSITHRGSVYVNGEKVAEHEGGFLPVLCDITNYVRKGEVNHLSVKANNELNERSLPCGAVKTLKNGTCIAAPYFDFFNYAGLNRSVYLVLLPEERIQDYSVNYTLDKEDALLDYEVCTNGTSTVKVSLFDKEGNLVAKGEGKKGQLKVEKAHLWKVRNAYLYTLKITVENEGKLIDEYEDKIGIRTVKVEGKRILINGEEVYLKGFGKHEDFDIIGRGFNLPLLKRDFECMKWMDANCFRTSHYPYAEEWYRFADEEGFLIIDEVAAVGMMRSLMNFADAKDTHFFTAPTVPELQKNHKAALEEMITRDKNHPSVIAFSIYNEPETYYQEAYDYFKPLFDYARELDPQKRPLTGAVELHSNPNTCLCYKLCDFVSLNRYYGWYLLGGPELNEAEKAFRKEMEGWKQILDGRPLIFTEFGGDTYASEHKLPSVMWSQEYQNEYYEMYFRVMDDFDFIKGELVWNFADFQTTEGIMRVNGNKKGIFTRNRQPKDAAFLLKKRWEQK